MTIYELGRQRAHELSTRAKYRERRHPTRNGEPAAAGAGAGGGGGDSQISEPAGQQGTRQNCASDSSFACGNAIFRESIIPFVSLFISNYSIVS
jgi:hypothetical protein